MIIKGLINEECLKTNMTNDFENLTITIKFVNNKFDSICVPAALNMKDEITRTKLINKIYLAIDELLK